MERQSKGLRDLEAYCSGGQGPPQAVAPTDDDDDGIYVRATCFDLIGHPQALQEHRFKRCLVFLHCGIPYAYKFHLQEQKLYKLVQIELVV